MIRIWESYKEYYEMMVWNYPIFGVVKLYAYLVVVLTLVIIVMGITEKPKENPQAHKFLKDVEVDGDRKTEFTYDAMDILHLIVLAILAIIAICVILKGIELKLFLLIYAHVFFLFQFLYILRNIDIYGTLSLEIFFQSIGENLYFTLFHSFVYLLITVILALSIGGAFIKAVVIIVLIAWILSLF